MRQAELLGLQREGGGVRVRGVTPGTPDRRLGLGELRGAGEEGGSPRECRGLLWVLMPPVARRRACL